MLVVAACAFLICALLTWLEIPFLKKLNAGQAIREEGPESHLGKSGTPTMGGISIILTVSLGMIILGYSSVASWLTLSGMILFALIGFIDDFKKVSKKHNLGLNAKQKVLLQLIASILLACGIYILNGSLVWIPGIDVYIDFGFFYIPFVVFVIISMVNAVNLTDGLDGLASGVSAIVCLFFIILGLWITETAERVDESFFAGHSMFILMFGACLGFLVFNKNPAKLFMGDTGSLAIGGGLTVAALMMHIELLLPIVGLVFVLEVLSVIIQVISYKTRGKRVFKMSPLHHHFELSGWSEWRVVLTFWGVTVGFCVIGFLICIM